MAARVRVAVGVVDMNQAALAARLHELFPGAEVGCGEGPSVEVTFDESFPTDGELAELTFTMLDSIAEAAGTRKLVLSFRDDSRHYESCSIIAHTMIFRLE